MFVVDSVLQFGASDDSGSDFDGDNSTLPFPKPLASSTFLEPDFDPTVYLATLSDRYQTLDDLRNELRDLSQSLSKELLDLVNNNYQEFLSLGSTLRGGEEKVEGVRVGMLSFQRDLISVRDDVEQRSITVATLVSERRDIMKNVETGKALLEISEMMVDLETSLMVWVAAETSLNGLDGQIHELSDASDEDAQDDRILVGRLKRQTEQYLVLRQLLQRHSRTQPYIRSQAERIARIESALTLDLEGALKQLEVSVQKDPLDIASSTRSVQGLLRSVTQAILQGKAAK